MRVIAGSAGGIPLKVPPLVARPTTDRVREAIFSMLGGRCENLRVLDLFAGSGSLGMEALSRGAAEAVFVEQHAGAVAVLGQNLQKTRLPNGRVIKAEVFATLRRLAQEGARFDLVFADPPYAKHPQDINLAEQLLQNDDLQTLLGSDGWLVLESMATKNTSEHIARWQIVRDRVYGATRILILTPSLSAASNAEIPPAAPA